MSAISAADEIVSGRGRGMLAGREARYQAKEIKQRKSSKGYQAKEIEQRKSSKGNQREKIKGKYQGKELIKERGQISENQNIEYIFQKPNK